MRGNGRVVTIVVVVAALSFAIGYLSRAVAFAGSEDGVSVNDAMRIVLLVAGGFLVVSLVAAYLIAASRSEWRGRGLMSLIVGTMVAVMVGAAIGATLHDGEPASPEWAVFVLVVVAVGAAIGYAFGRRPQQEPPAE